MSSSSVYFRNFDQLEADGQLDDTIKAEFPSATEDLNDGVSRRRWLQIMGASIALGTAAGCRYQQEFIAPYAHRPKNRMPGVPVKYATTMDVRGVGRPLLATSFDGRPIKLDGNIDFAAEGGGSDVHVQATVLELYDPDRSRNPVEIKDGKSTDKTWSDLQHAVGHWFENSNGAGIAFLVEPTSSPSFARLKGEVQKKYPQSQWFEYTSINDDNQRAGIKHAAGEVFTPVYQLDKAKVIVSIDADLLGSDPMALVNSKKWSEGRDADHQKMSRMYVVESFMSATGTMADHRLPLRPSKIAGFLAALVKEVDSRLENNDTPVAGEGDADRSTRILQAMAHDLVSNKGAGCVAIGEAHSAEAHALVWSLNHKLGNFADDGAIKLIKPFDADRELLAAQINNCAEALAGGIEKLVIVGGNPVYDAPAELNFGDAVSGVKNSVHFSVYKNETSRKCKWHGNLSHPLESWGDSRAFDSTFCIAQPLIAPLHDGKSVLEVMDWLAHFESAHGDEAGHGDDHGASAAAMFVAGEKKQVVAGESFVQETAKQFINSDFEAGWTAAVHKGFIEGTEQYASAPSGEPNSVEVAESKWSEKWDGGDVEMRFIPCQKVFDGRFANSGWLQELPDSVSKLTWENAAVVNPTTAEKLDLNQNHLANLDVGVESVQLPVFKVPGVPDGVVVVSLGYGRTAAGRVAGDEEKGIAARGVDVGPLRQMGDQWYWRPSVTVIGSRTKHILPTTQEHFDMLGEFGQDEVNTRIPELIKEGTYDSYLEFMKHQEEHGAESNGHSSNKKRSTKFTPVAYRKDESEEKHDDKGGDDHGHSHHASWPAGKHHHFENKSLGPGFLRNVPPEEYGYVDSPKWGMSIDLNDCTGCGACTIACQAENNIPIVGPEQVKKGRELHWIRVDRYFRTNGIDELENAEVVYQPVNCQQCENAPCETVCPVAATIHSDDGLNDMVYNRCIGTRYCGNNCPYKVRRFNYLNFSDDVNLANQFVKLYHGAVELSPADRALQSMVRNPEVTVRSRGVMEKCTFCTQRIQAAKIATKSSDGKNSRIPANSIKTACQEACPTNAIKFGDLSNEKSDVTKMHANKRSYVLLEELNNHPRLKYLARVRNPHPALVHAEKNGH